MSLLIEMSFWEVMIPPVINPGRVLTKKLKAAACRWVSDLQGPREYLHKHMYGSVYLFAFICISSWLFELSFLNLILFFQ